MERQKRTENPWAAQMALPLLWLAGILTAWKGTVLK